MAGNRFYFRNSGGKENEVDSTAMNRNDTVNDHDGVDNDTNNRLDSSSHNNNTGSNKTRRSFFRRNKNKSPRNASAMATTAIVVDHNGNGTSSQISNENDGSTEQDTSHGHDHYPPNVSNVMMSYTTTPIASTSTPLVENALSKTKTTTKLKVQTPITSSEVIANHALKTARASNKSMPFRPPSSPATATLKSSVSSSSQPPEISSSSSSSSTSIQLSRKQSSFKTIGSSSNTTASSYTPSNGGIRLNSSSTRKLPGVFTLIEQGNWKLVNERAKKYPHECEKWVTMKRKHNHHSSSMPSISPSSAMSTYTKSPSTTTMTMASPRSIFRKGGGTLHAKTSFATHGTTETKESLSTNATTSSLTMTRKGYTNVNCKALHHAFHKLRHVPSQIKVLISNELNEYESYCSLQQEQQQHHYSPPSTPKSTMTPFSSPVSSSHKPVSLERTTTATTTSTSCPSVCHITDGSSFDDLVDNIQNGKLSPTLDRVVNCIKRSIPSTLTSSSFPYNKEYDMEWDDPWIEACKAILTILEVYPDVVKERETRHGCLPLHLAAFAMVLTPNDVTIPNDYIRYKYCSRPIHAPPPPASTSCSNSSSVTPSRKQQIVATASSTVSSLIQQPLIGQGTNNDVNTSLHSMLSPNPLHLRRGKSNSSVASNTSDQSSIGGYSTVLEERNGSMYSISSFGGQNVSINNDDAIQDSVTETMMVSLEEKLRLNKSASATDSSRFGGITEEEEGVLLGRFSRPPPISTSYDRVSSIDSMFSTGSNSVISNCSTTAPSITLPTETESPEFYLDKYVSNAQRRDEYSLKVIEALIRLYKKGAAKDSEGGRLPLHMAMVGKATYSVIYTLVKAHPYAVRHRTKDGSLPLHLAAYYGVSHDEVASTLLRHYPFATIGKNRFERTPLEEALLMGGENGRQHQMKLVEALRRSAHFWTSQNNKASAAHFDSNR